MSELFFAAALSSICVTVYSIVKREAKSSLYFTILSLNITFYAISTFIVASSTSLEGASIGGAFAFLGQPFIGAIWFLYTADICEKPIKNKWTISAILALPIATSLLMFTSTYHNLLFDRVYYEANGILPIMHYAYKPIYYIGLLYTYILNIISSIMIVIKLTQKKKTFRIQYVFHLSAGILMLLVGTVFILSGNPYHKYAVSFALCISQIILCIGLFKVGAFRVVTLARDKIVENMIDGLIIFSKNSVYMDSNKAANTIFPALTTISPGTQVDVINGILTKKLLSSELHEFDITNGNDKKYYRSSITNITEGEKYIGTSIIIHNITEIRQLMDTLKDMAHIDSLTQIYNRGYFEKVANKEIETMKRLQLSVCAAMLDIDFFKKINDTYGHIFGDYVLQTISKEINAQLRAGDLFARYGGEEFCALLFNANTEQSLTVLNRVRACIEALEIKQGEINCKATVSIGVAEVDYSIKDPLKAALSCADAALYNAKQSGKNKVCLLGTVRDVTQ